MEVELMVTKHDNRQGEYRANCILKVGKQNSATFSHHKPWLFVRHSPQMRLASRQGCVCSSLLPPPVLAEQCHCLC